MKDLNHLTGDELVDAMQIANETSDPGYGIALLDRIADGYSLENLSRLLQSENNYAASEGAWLLSECGKRAPQLLRYLPAMVLHKCWKVRYWAVDFVLLAASENDGQIVCEALSLMGDEEAKVRWMAIKQFSKLPLNVLQSAYKTSVSTAHRENISDGIFLMIRFNEDKALKDLKSDKACVRSFAASAFFRYTPNNSAFLNALSDSFDPALVGLKDDVASR